MTRAVLERDYLSDRTIGCLSYISFGKWYQFSTLELPYKNNQIMVSCVPENDMYDDKLDEEQNEKKHLHYIASRHYSKKAGKTFSIESPGRTGIIFHAGNTAKDTQGCILIGEYFEMHRDTGPYLMNSAKAFELFKKSLDAFSYFELIIKKRVS